MNLSVVRPLVNKLYEAKDVSMGKLRSYRREGNHISMLESLIIISRRALGKLIFIS